MLIAGAIWPAISHQIVLDRESYYFACEECVENSPFGPILIERRDQLYELKQAQNWINEG